MNRIIFFSKEDGAFVTFLKNIDNYIKNIYPNVESFLINDILELDHICKYFENGFRPNEWIAEDDEKNLLLVKSFKKSIRIFFDTLTSTSLISSLSDVEHHYTQSYLLLINNFGLYKKIESNEFKLLLQNKKLRIRELLACKNFVAFFENEIRQHFISNNKLVEILLDYYEKNNDNNVKELFFPKSLTLKDREYLVNEYLDNPSANLNYVRLIVKNKDSEFLYFSDKTRLKAKKLAEKLNNDILKNGYIHTIRKSIHLTEDQDEIKKVKLENDTQIISYNRNKLTKNKDYLSLINLFKSPFDLIDFQGCIDLVPRQCAIGPLETIFMRSKNEYHITNEFRSKSYNGYMHMEIFKIIIEDLGLRVEDLIEKFVNVYLNSEFSVNEFNIFLPSKNTNYLEKVRAIAPEFESLFKQYKLFVENNIIDQELMQISTKTTKFNNIPSLLEKKYLYPIGEEYNKIVSIFFKNTSPLFNYSKYGEKYSNFYHLLLFEKVSYHEHNEYERKYLDHFINENYIQLDHNNNIEIVNPYLLSMIGHLHKFDVISYWHFPLRYRVILDAMEENKMVESSSSLLTKAEQSYFDYYLNNRFSNGQWLRNKYVHATNTTNEKIQESDYKILLKLLIFLVLKIEDDLSLSKISNQFKED
ncbi:hypothetical protein [uncultured Chryseobacterium sp.]|jgi:hypothetical protein|uniref:hypothetical protein n=1 Tax=uncultured Chryseobacterium sp. TaxID=259322 RepID=UPI00262E256C|nr:hypothetical protein [uncultured Chryseobacterium sp.]